MSNTCKRLVHDMIFACRATVRERDPRAPRTTIPARLGLRTACVPNRCLNPVFS